MLIAQIAIDQQVIYMTPHAPFVMKVHVAKASIATYWKTWTGIDESSLTMLDIISFVRDSLYRYSEMSDISSMLNQEQSFIFDKINQILYVHFEHGYNIFSAEYSYGLYFGYTNGSIVYIDEIEYLPLISNQPKISQSQDFNGYDKLTYSNTTLELNNTAGDMDSLISLDIYGNTVKILYIDESEIVDCVFSGDASPLASYFIEDYTISMQIIKFNLQDLRKSMTTKIPRNIFTSTQYANIDNSNKSKPIPFLYGQVEDAPATCTNGKTTSGNVNYRVAEFLTQLSLDGKVQIQNGDIWSSVTPLSVDLSTGSFVVASASARNGTTVLKCKVFGPIGLAINYTSDIIRDINNRFLGIPFTSSNYDIDEWSKEEIALSSGGILFNKLVDSYEAIRQIQNGSIVGFRYEFNFSGKRTIRIDDFNRPVGRTINNVDILNIDELDVDNDTSNVFAEIQINYSKSYNDDKYQSVIDSTKLTSVKNKFKQQTRSEIDTVLYTEANAIIRASNDAEKFSNIRPVINLDLAGKEFFDLRIYDIVNSEITKGFVDLESNTVTGREFYGIKKCQIISISPDDKTGVQSCSAVIIGNYDYDTNYITESGDYYMTEDGYLIGAEK